MKYEPELGQAIFGQPHQEYGASSLMTAALRDISREWERVMWNRWQRTIDNPFDNTGALWVCDTFEVRAYSWAECSCDAFDEDEEWSSEKCTCGYKPQTYNFKYKDIEVSWYKYLGRGMSQNRSTTPSEIAEMLESCLEALKNC